MTDPAPRPARWSVPALMVTFLGGALITWSLRATPVVAVLAGAAVTVTIIAVTEVVRRCMNREASIDSQWERVADDWRRRHL